MTRRTQKPQPQFPGRIIDRPRLLKKIEESTARTILLIAPAGYGKTTLLRQVLAESGGVWIALNRKHADHVVLARELADALSSVLPGIRQAVEEAISGTRTTHEEIHAIERAILASVPSEHPLTLIVDNWQHLLVESSGELLLTSLESSEHFRVILASRTRPRWATVRRLLYGQIIELTQEDLVLTDEETNLILGEAPGLRLARKYARGWPALVGVAATLDGASSTRRSSKSLHAFIADEIYSATPPKVQRDLMFVALLPSFSRKSLEQVIGRKGLAKIAATGLAHEMEESLDLHPLLRDFLYEKATDASARTVVDFAIDRAMRERHWETAFFIMKRFKRAELMTTLIDLSFLDLVETGRLETLQAIGIHAAKHGLAPHCLLDMIDAELSFRDGSFSQARNLALAASRSMPRDHTLKARSHIVAGMCSHLSWQLDDAVSELTTGMSVAQRPRDRNDAALARCVSALFLEESRLPEFMNGLSSLTETTAEDRVRVLMARQSFARLKGGLYDVSQDADVAEALLSDITNPLVRTGWGNTFGYTLILQARYRDARATLASAVQESERSRLKFARPHLEWSLAAAELGLRRFAQAEGSLRRVEEAAQTAANPYLELNARSLRARLLLAVQRPTDALRVTEHEFSSVPARAMLGEYLATRALALATAGRPNEAEASARRATSTSQAVEVRVLAEAARAVAMLATKGARTQAERLIELCSDLQTWDGLVCAIRAAPTLANELAGLSSHRSQLLHVLTGSRDMSIAYAAGLTPKRPQAKSGPLSRREAEVLDLLAKGLRTREIAATLYIAPSTVKGHIIHIFQKLDVHTRAEAVARYADTST